MTTKLHGIAKSLIICMSLLFTPFVLAGGHHLIVAQDDNEVEGSHVTGTYGSEQPSDEGSHVTGTYGGGEKQGQGEPASRGMPPQEGTTGYQAPSQGSTGYQAPDNRGGSSTGYQPQSGASSTGYQTGGSPSTGYQVRGGTGPSASEYRIEYYYPETHHYYTYDGYRWAPYHRNRVPQGADVLYYKRDGRPVFACSVRIRDTYYLGQSVAGGPCKVKIKGRDVFHSVFDIRF